MRLINTTTTLGALTLAAAALYTACGAGDTAGSAQGYCDQLKTDKTYFQSIDGSDPDVTKLDEAFERMHSLAASAPPTLAKDWATLDDAVGTIEDGLEEAGLSFDDLAAIQEGEVPADVDLEKLAELGSRFEALTGGELDAAAGRIADHAKDTCGFELPLA
jgi:hypothetical protein